MAVETLPINLYVPSKAIPVLESPGFRYRCLYGGRGSGKSTAFASYVILNALSNKRILCCREIQNSIRDSVHKLLVDRIKEMGLVNYFDVTQDSIKSRYGAEIVFRGLRNNVTGIRSLEGIDIAWVEEAENVSENSWDILIPTIRQPNSEIWISFNPDHKGSSTYKRFVESKRDDVISELVNWNDNDFFPDVLRKEMEYDKKVDPEKYQHIWEGQIKSYGEDLIIKNWSVEDFETPADAEFRFGSDFGFSKDPSVLGRMFIKGTTLFIDHEAYGHGVEINELEAFFDSVPESRRWKITCDSERPDTISYLRQKGFNAVGALKGKGSVEDGIQFLRSFEAIKIHPRCVHAKEDFGNFRWKRDKVTNEILPVPKEGSDHWPDAARYGLEDYIKNKNLDIKFL